MCKHAGLLQRFFIILLVVLVSACSESGGPKLQVLPENAVILAFGDSLTYGTGADHDTESYPAVLAHLSGHKIINAGIPGEVSSEGLARLDDLLELHQPDLVLLCHGGNDLIRRLNTETLKQNLIKMVTKIRQSGAEVVMLSVPELGIFLKPAGLYKEVAESQQVILENSIIADIESKTALKSDPIHPNAKGYKLLAETVQALLLDYGALN